MKAGATFPARLLPLNGCQGAAVTHTSAEGLVVVVLLLRFTTVKVNVELLCGFSFVASAQSVLSM